MNEIVTKQQKHRNVNLKKWLISQQTTLLVLIFVAIGISTMMSPFFADLGFILDSTSMYIEFSIIAISMTFIIISGNIDLSVAAIMALTGCITGMFFEAGTTMVLAMILGLAFGTLLGLFNGFLVAVLKLPSMIVTIGTMALFRGVAQIFIGDHSLGHFPDWFVGIDMKYIKLVPYPLIICIILAIVFGLILNNTVFGRYVYAIGNNEIGARYSAVPVKKVKLILFGMSGLFAGLGGILTMSRLGVSRFDMALGGELDVITIVLLGGTDISGGKGNMVGSILAMFLIIILRTGMSVANVKIEKQLTIMGALLILAIVIPNVIKVIKERKEDQ